MLQQKAARLAIKKAGCCPEDIRIIFAGDLLAQSIASSFGIGELERPMYGVFGACSTMGEALSLGAITVSAGHGERVLAVTSSHFATAEKEFRFPLGYGNQRPLSASWTVTGSGACVLNRKKGRVKITGLTIGKVVDYGLKDSQNMGACMAPAAAELIEANFKDLDVDKDYYDAIFTGDLGEIGNRILSELLKEKGIDIVVLDMPLLDTRRGKDLMGTFLSDIVLQVLSFVAENERANLRQRQAEGIAAAKARGVRFGRPPRPLPENFHSLHRAWRAKTMTLRQAAGACGLPVATFYSKARKLEQR